MMAGALGAGVILLALVASVLDLSAGVTALSAPAALFGLVSPVIGYRLYVYLREKAPTGESAEQAGWRFLQATIGGLAVTEAAALFGVVAFTLGGDLFALVGVPMHVLLSGTLWPSKEKLSRFIESAAR